MKKLLIAMMSVASLAFISKADTFSGTTGTSFESLTLGAELDVESDDAGTTAGKKLWSSTAESVGVVTNANLEGWTGAKPAIAGATDEKALMVEAESRLVRSIDVTEDTNASISYDIGTGIYFDTMVQFTATDTAPTPESGDKLVVWLYGSAEEDGAFGIGTNLIVTAGNLKTAGQTTTATNYIVSVAGVDVQPNSWHRLTIKTISDIGSDDKVAGFVVFIDGVPATSSAVKGDEDSVFGGLNAVAKKWDDMGALFPSLVFGTLDTQKLTSVSLEGTGMIDDITFTSVAPAFAKDSDIFTLSWDEYVTALSVTVGSTTTDLTAEQVAAKTYSIDIDGSTTVTVAPTFTTGYAKNAWAITGAATESDNVFTVTGTATATLSSKDTIVRAYVTMDGETVEYNSLAAAVTFLSDETIPVDTKATLKINEAVVGDNLFIDIINPDLTLDLNGYTITGTVEGSADPVIAAECVMIITDTSAAKTGKVIAQDGQLAVLNDYDLTIEDGKFNGAIESYVADTTDPEYDPEHDDSALLTVNGGYFTSLPVAKKVVLKEGFSWTTAPDANGYYTLTEGGEEPTAYKLTIPEVTGATAAVTAGGETVADLTQIANGTEVVVTWTLTEGYKLTAGSLTETITMTADTTAATPTVKAITYATVTITPVENCTITVKNGEVTVTTGAKFDVDEEVELTVTRAAAEGYELDNCAAEETVKMTEDKTITAAVKSTTPAEKDYPAYIAEGDKQKYDTWASTYEIADRKDTDAALQDAYLLNVAPAKAESEAAKFACVSITVNGTTVTVTASARNSDGNAYNGTVEIRGSATLTGTYDLPADSTAARFFKAFLK